MNKIFKIDLHTHSVLSRDGGLARSDYARLFEKKLLDFIAITDHNETAFARKMNREFGEKIIIGEEITSLEGEIIGLFIKETIPPRLSAKQTAEMIRDQGGLVYIPHPFEKLRHGISEETLVKILDRTDIIEVFNARARFRGAAKKAIKFARDYNLASASSSDSHCRLGIGSSYSIVHFAPDAKNFPGLLANGSLIKHYAPILSYLCPAINKIKRKILPDS